MGERLSAVLDRINVRYGPNSSHYKFFERG